MNGTRGYSAKRNKSVRERQLPRFHSYVEVKKQNRRTQRKGRKKKKMKTGMEADPKRHLTIGKRQGCWRGGRVGGREWNNWVMGIKEGT